MFVRVSYPNFEIFKISTFCIGQWIMIYCRYALYPRNGGIGDVAGTSFFMCMLRFSPPCIGMMSLATTNPL